MILNIKVKPGSRINELAVEKDFSIKVKIKAPPVDGKANKELIIFLSRILEIPTSHIELISGEFSQNKRVKFFVGEKIMQQKLNSLKR